MPMESPGIFREGQRDAFDCLSPHSASEGRTSALADCSWKLSKCEKILTKIGDKLGTTSKTKTSVFFIFINGL